MAGGPGEHLIRLTRESAKPAAPCGGANRFFDFTLSNCISSGLRRIFSPAPPKSREGRRTGAASDSVAGAKLIFLGGQVFHSSLSPGAPGNSYCEVERSILMPGVDTGRDSRIHRAVIITGVRIPESS
jgi:ADP-glucose pyrophosphorylase